MIDIILNWVRLNRKSIIQTFELYKDEVEKKKAPIVENEEISKIPKEPTVPTKLETENKIWIWSECSCPRTPKVKINKKTVEIFDTKDLIITSHDPYRKTYINQKNAIQEKGAKVYLCVHPWYKPWKGKSIEQCAQITKEFMGEYDGVVIDLEGVVVKKLDDTMKHFSSIPNLWVAPKMDSKYLDDYYDKIKDWQVNYLWWNYALTLNKWNAYFDKYKFPTTSKHNLLLSFAKYLYVVPLSEISNIAENSPLRVGAFNPKTKDKINLNKLKKDLETEK